MRPRRIGVVVPARNEEQVLLGCLESLAASAARCTVPVHLAVVLDGCVDGSARLVADFAATKELSLTALPVQAHRVGTARAAGARRLSVDCDWLATTDADSNVPLDWFQRQLAHAADGADAVVGTVRVDDWSERAALARCRAEAAYAQSRGTPGHGHIHGANLAFATEAYRRAGGFADLATGEDVALVHALAATGARIVWATDLPVVTSARTLGRAPDGFAGYLDALEQRPA